VRVNGDDDHHSRRRERVLVHIKSVRPALGDDVVEQPCPTKL
jgi:hypothetical protein